MNRAAPAGVCPDRNGERLPGGTPVSSFVVYHHRSPTVLGESAIRAFLDHLVREQRVSRSTHGVYVAAIHFLYRVTLDRPAVVQPPALEIKAI